VVLILSYVGALKGAEDLGAWDVAISYAVKGLEDINEREENLLVVGIAGYLLFTEVC
jgi:hypothetical protein